MHQTEVTVDQRRARNVATVRRYYGLQEAMDLDAWLDLWADDGAQAIPYAPDGFPTLVAGKAELRRVYSDLFAGFRRLQILDLTVDPLLDPDRVLARWHTRADSSPKAVTTTTSSGSSRSTRTAPSATSPSTSTRPDSTLDVELDRP